MMAPNSLFFKKYPLNLSRHYKVYYLSGASLPPLSLNRAIVRESEWPYRQSYRLSGLSNRTTLKIKLSWPPKIALIEIYFIFEVM